MTTSPRLTDETEEITTERNIPEEITTLAAIDNAEENVSVTTTVNAFEEDYTTLEINTEQSPTFESEVENVPAAEEIFEEGVTEDNFLEEASTTDQPDIEVFTQQTTNVESTEVEREASGATAEEDTLAEDPVLESTTFKVDLEEITTTEIITTFEALPDHITTTEYPNEEISSEQPTMLNEEETSTVMEDPAEATSVGTEDISSTEVLGTNEISGEIAEEEEEEEEDYVSTTEAPSEDDATNKQSTEKPTTIEDETVEVTTLETEPRDFSTEQAFGVLTPTAFKDEVLTNDSAPEQPNTSEAVDEQPETFTATPEETSTTTDVNSEELSITEVIPENTTTFDDMVREIPSKKEVFDQDSFDVEIETTTIAFDEVATTEAFTESSVAFEAKTTGTTTSFTNENEGDISTSGVEITTSATDFQTTQGQLNKQPKIEGSPVGETTMTDVVTERLLPEEVENVDITQSSDDSKGEINEETSTEQISEDKTAEPIMEQTTTPNTLLEEETTRNNRPGESTTTDEVTTEASSTVVMTHTYVMQERKNGSRMETDDISNEIPVDVQPEMKGDASSKLLDLVTQNFSEADNIIFDTEEIAPVKAPEDGIAQRTTKGVTNTQDPSFLDRIQEDRIRDQETVDGTSYRTEKSISKVVTEISV